MSGRRSGSRLRCRRVVASWSRSRSRVRWIAIAAWRPARPPAPPRRRPASARRRTAAPARRPGRRRGRPARSRTPSARRRRTPRPRAARRRGKCASSAAPRARPRRRRLRQRSVTARSVDGAVEGAAGGGGNAYAEPVVGRERDDGERAGERRLERGRERGSHPHRRRRGQRPASSRCWASARPGARPRGARAAPCGRRAAGRSRRRRTISASASHRLRRAAASTVDRGWSIATPRPAPSTWHSRRRGCPNRRVRRSIRSGRHRDPRAGGPAAPRCAAC